jgi:hypothetical protein
VVAPANARTVVSSRPARSSAAGAVGSETVASDCCENAVGARPAMRVALTAATCSGSSGCAATKPTAAAVSARSVPASSSRCATRWAV